MKNSNYTVRVIEPETGFYLTQAADVNVEDRILSKKIFLAINDSEDNWKEISDMEAEVIKAEQERIAREKAETEVAE